MASRAELLAVLLLATGCVSTAAPPVDRLPARDDRPYLQSPVEDYPRAIGRVTAQRLEEAYRTLTELGDRGPASALVGELLGREPDLEPARVLAAQVDLVEGRCDDALTRLTAVVEAYPSYAPAQLVFGRCSERLGNLVEALESYLRIADGDSLAAGRVEALRGRAVEVMALRVEDLLTKGRTAEAERALERLQGWAPEEPRTLEIAVDLATATGDRQAELTALQRLAATGPLSRQRQQQRAQLELEIGDAGIGMRLLEDLYAQNPEDLQLEEELARARFLWRMQLLPPDIRDLATKPQLERADLAAFLFWVFPEVRYGRASSARIANDVLDHPFREEIVRVVNLDLMEVDPNLHRFDPYRPLQRGELLSGLLSLFARSEPTPSCLRAAAPRLPTGEWGICELATDCGLLKDPADCLPGIPVAGPEAIDLFRTAQEALAGG